MRRFDPRVLLVLPLLAVGGCGGDEPEPLAPSAPAPLPTSAAPLVTPSATPSDDDPFGTAEPSAPVTEEQDAEPTTEPEEISDEASAYLDEALARELTVLEGKGAAGKQRETLDKLPDSPAKVLSALKEYRWTSPEAKKLYDKAVATS